MLTGDALRRAASETGFRTDSLEKGWMLVRLLKLMFSHPFLGPRVALKGGTALNLFIFDLPRLSVDINVNYIGATDREGESAFLERLNEDGEIKPELLTRNADLQRRILDNPGLRWKALNVQTHQRADATT